MLREEGVRVYRENLLDDHALRLLRVIVESTGARIVVSSTWRKLQSTLEALRFQLAGHSMEIYDVTPAIGGIRGDDITAYLRLHPEVSSYAILDDDSDMGVHMDHLVQTSFDSGLTRREVDQCISLLNTKEEVTSCPNSP